MDFGGMVFSTCECEFLSALRAYMGYELPADRDLHGNWVDEKIQRYLDVDLRYVPDTPPMVQMKDWYPHIYKKRMRNFRDMGKYQKSKMPDIIRDFPYAAMTLEQIRAIKPVFKERHPFLEWMISTASSYRASGFPTTVATFEGFYEEACWKRGYEQTALDMAMQPDLLRALFDIWLQEKMHVIDIFVKPLAPYIDIFVFGDDLGMQSGPFMSLEMFRELVKPYMRETYRAVREAAPDSFIMHHSCGSIYALLDDLIDVGIHVMNPTQPNALDMTPELLKEKCRGRMCFHGGIDLQQLLPFGTPDEVKEEATRRMAILGEGGGYICAPAHTLPDDVPVENILALFRAHRRGKNNVAMDAVNEAHGRPSLCPL
jgi:uroporphyrinogen decarboxylase